MRGQYELKTNVEMWIAESVQDAKMKLYAGPRALAPQVVGLTIPEAEKLLADWVHDSLAALHRGPDASANVPRVGPA